MASKPISTCCVTGFKHEGTPIGRLESEFVKTQLGSVEAYISTPPADKDRHQGLLLYVSHPITPLSPHRTNSHHQS